MKKKFLIGLVISFFVIGIVNMAWANTIYWTDWTGTTIASPGVTGALTIGSDTIDVDFSGAYSFAQTSGGTNYWNPSAPYLSALVDNAPPASDIIALGNGGTKTISFSQTIQDPLLALVSWNGNVVDFGVPIEIVSYGAGYFGSGTPIINGGGTGFTGSGEVHGVIRLIGSYGSISFTDTSEYWHGFTVGVTGLSQNPVPEPATMLLFGIGLLGLAGVNRKK